MKIIFYTSFFFFLLTQFCFAQWVQIGLNEEMIKNIAVQNQNIFAVTQDLVENRKLYRSIDNGANWTMEVDSFARDVAISPTGKVFMIKDTTDCFGWHTIELFTSLDNGDNWMLVNIIEQIQDSLYVEEYGATKITVSNTGIIFVLDL